MIDASFTEPLQMRRSVGAVDETGVFVEQPPIYREIQAAVIPIADERTPLTEGLRRDRIWRIFTLADLQAIAPDSRGDELLIKGAWCRVIKVERWSGEIGTFVDAEAVVSA